jgi:hypothetical protein
MCASAKISNWFDGHLRAVHIAKAERIHQIVIRTYLKLGDKKQHKLLLCRQQKGKQNNFSP